MPDDRLTIHLDDLRRVEAAVRLRHDRRDEEARRAARMRHFAVAAAELGRTLSTYARHALVHCQGTAGATDFGLDTEALAAALRMFADEVRSVADGPHARGRPVEAPLAMRAASAPVARHGGDEMGVR